MEDFRKGRFVSGVRGVDDRRHVPAAQGSGAIIDAEDECGRTPLQLALKLHDIATCLTEHGATR